MRTLGRFISIALAVLLLIAGLVLFEYNRAQLGEETVGQKLDRSLERTGKAATTTGDEVARAARDRALVARDMTTEAADSVRDRASAGIEKGADKIGAAQAAVQGRIDRTSDAISDAAITASINADILKDPGLSSRRVQVFSRQGEVTLQGSVETETARQRAERMAGAVAGVTKVDNQLVVTGPPPASR